MNHFSHPQHKLSLVYSELLFKCDGCQEVGIGSRFNCSHCDFDLHSHCAAANPAAAPLRHTFYPECLFNFLTCPPGDSPRYCDACGKDVIGFVYHCRKSGYDLHPCCAALPREHHIDGALCLRLQPRASAPCNWCSQMGKSWCYRSDCNKYNLHVACAMDMSLNSRHELLKKGRSRGRGGGDAGSRGRGNCSRVGRGGLGDDNNGGGGNGRRGGRGNDGGRGRGGLSDHDSGGCGHSDGGRGRGDGGPSRGRGHGGFSDGGGRGQSRGDGRGRGRGGLGDSGHGGRGGHDEGRGRGRGGRGDGCGEGRGRGDSGRGDRGPRGGQGGDDRGNGGGGGHDRGGDSSGGGWGGRGRGGGNVGGSHLGGRGRSQGHLVGGGRGRGDGSVGRGDSNEGRGRSGRGRGDGGGGSSGDKMAIVLGNESPIIRTDHQSGKVNMKKWCKLGATLGHFVIAAVLGDPSALIIGIVSAFLSQ